MIRRSVAAGIIAAGALTLTTTASPAEATGGRVEVIPDHVCVKVSSSDGFERRYVLTRFLVVHVDRKGNQLGPAESTRWKRWNRGEHPRKWERLCG